MASAWPRRGAISTEPDSTTDVGVDALRRAASATAAPDSWWRCACRRVAMPTASPSRRARPAPAGNRRNPARAIRGTPVRDRCRGVHRPAPAARCGRRCRGRRRRRRSARECRRRAPAAGRSAAFRRSRTGDRGSRASSGRTARAARAPARPGGRTSGWRCAGGRARARHWGELMAYLESVRAGSGRCSATWPDVATARPHTHPRLAPACARRDRWW